MNTAKKIRVAAKRALRGQPKRKARPAPKKKRETFAAETRRKARRRPAGPVNVIDGPLPKRKPGKIAAGGALTVAFEFNAQELRDLRVLAVGRGYPTPSAWTLQKERAAAKWMLPKFVADQIEAGRPKAPETVEGGAQ